MRRWSGEDVDLSRRLPSDLIVAAADADPQLHEIVDPYSRMDALPASLAPAEPRARAIFADGWRPAVPDGPTRDELAELCSDYAVRRRLIRRGPSDGQPLDAVDERRHQPVRFFGRGDVGNLTVQFLERHGDLAASQVGAEAEMRAAATEADVRIGMAPHIEGPRIGELGFVAVRRVVPQRNLVARSQFRAAELEVAR